MDMKEIQTKLKELNLYTGEISGIQGPNTTAAIRAFQRLNGLKVDGIAGPNTIRILLNENVIERPEVMTVIQSEKRTQWPDENTQSLNNFYGPVGTNQTTLELPFEFKIAWDLRKTIKRTQCHIKCEPYFKEIWGKVHEQFTWNEIENLGLNIFGGLLNVRPIRGGTRFSTHSWGIAWDVDPIRNQLTWRSDRARLARPDADKFWKIVEETGATSLGKKVGFDYQHFQFANR